MTKRELMQMALDSLVSRCGTNAEEQKILIPMLRAELEKPEPEPVAYITNGGNGDLWWYQSLDEDGNNNKNDIPLYRKEDV